MFLIFLFNWQIKIIEKLMKNVLNKVRGDIFE